jgi:hypothetical protein
MGAGTNREVDVGSWDAELLEKHVRHVHVIVLAGMD